MKKFGGVLLSLLIVPVLLLGGCGEIDAYYKGLSIHNDATAFLGSAVSVVDTVQNNIKNADTSKFSEQTTFGTEFNNAFSRINKLNKQMRFGMIGYDMFKAEKELGFQDISFMSGTQSAILKNFSTKHNSTMSNGHEVYYSAMTGEETADLNLPVIQKALTTTGNGMSVTLDSLLDEADALIKTWGNFLTFEVWQNDGGIVAVKISTTFDLPKESDIPNEFVWEIDKTNSVVRMVYGSGEKTYSKVVDYKQAGNKIVTKYEGNIITDKSNTEKNIIGSYYYYFDVDKTSEFNVLGSYTFLYKQNESYVLCTYQDRSVARQVEYYKTTDHPQEYNNKQDDKEEKVLDIFDQVLGRFYNYESNETYAYDLLVNKDQESGKLKLKKFNKQGAKLPLATTSAYISKTFATKADNDTLAGATSARILTYYNFTKSVIDWE